MRKTGHVSAPACRSGDANFGRIFGLPLESEPLPLEDERHHHQLLVQIFKRLQAVEHGLQALKRVSTLGNSTEQAPYFGAPFNTIGKSTFSSSTSHYNSFAHGDVAGALQQPSSIGYGISPTNGNGFKTLQCQSAPDGDTEHSLFFDFDAAAGQESNVNKQVTSTAEPNDYGVDHHSVRFNHTPQTVHPAWLDVDNDFAPGNYATLQPQPDTLSFQPEQPAMDIFNDSLLLNPSPVQADDHSDLYRALGLIPSDMHPLSNEDDAVAIAPSISNVTAPQNIQSITVLNTVVASTTAPRTQRSRLNRIRGTIPCAYCMKTFGRTSDLGRHLRVHDANAVRYACPALGCDKVGNNGYLRPDLLKRHRVKMGH